MDDDEYRTPPNIEGKTLDFSMFHPADHSVFACRGYPGGRRRHLEYQWLFFWHPWLMSNTVCRVGRHCETQWWGRGRTWKACQHCGKKLSEPQEV